MKPCIVMDIDGTLANAEHRLHLLPANGGSWEAFFAAAGDDTPNAEIVLLNNKFAEDHPVFIVTGRDARDEEMTTAWLLKHRIDFDRLYMRPRGDRREDSVVKAEVLAEIRAEGYEPLFAVEDRARVVAMWRANGVRCLQVCEGNY